MQLVQQCSIAVMSCANWACGVSMGYVAIFSNAGKFRCLYSQYGSCMPSSPKEYTVNSLLKDSLYRGHLRYNGHSQGTN